MDKSTHEVRLANGEKIIEQCANRSQGTTAKQCVTKMILMKRPIITGCGGSA